MPFGREKPVQPPMTVTIAGETVEIVSIPPEPPLSRWITLGDINPLAPSRQSDTGGRERD